MSLPTLELVGPSTTQVEINPLQSPYTPVLLNPIQYPGQVVSIVDGTSSLGVLTTPIVVSTAITNSYLDGSISTLINQPQGFITVQSFSTNKWAFLNSFPFRNQYLSAGLLNLTTSTLFTALTSANLEYVGSLTVENLIVTGNFIQSQGITLNTNVSSLGTVEILSSLNVWGDTYLSSALSTIGLVNLYSSLFVGSDFTIPSSIVTQSSLYISGSLIAMGLLSTPSIQLGDGLRGTNLDVNQDANLAGSLQIFTTLSTNSSAFIGGFLSASNTQASTANFLSSVSLYQTAEIQTFVSTLQNFSTTGSLGIGGQLSVGLDLTVVDDIKILNDGNIRDLLTITSTLVTSSMVVGQIEVQGDYTNLSSIVSLKILNVNSNLGAVFVSSASTFVSGSLTTYGTLGSGDLTILSYLNIQNGISSLGNVSSGQNFLLEGSLSTFGSTFASYVSTLSSLSVVNSTILLLEGQSTTIEGNLFGLGNLFCEGTLTISSITLPSSLLANSFVAGSADIGTTGIVNQMTIGGYVTSSVTFGFIQNSPYSFDLSGSLFFNSSIESAVSLSTNILSTNRYLVPNISSAYIRVESGMAIATEIQNNSFNCGAPSLFLGDMTVQQTLSTSILNTLSLDGTLRGDASLLFDINYPRDISVATFLVESTIYVRVTNSNIGITASTMNIRDINLGGLTASSTINIGSIEFRGDDILDYNSGRNTIQASTLDRTLVVNDVQFSGDGINEISKRVIIGLTDESFPPLAATSNINFPITASLFVFGTLAADNFNATQNNLQLVTTSTIADKIVTELFTGSNIYISTGTISTISGPFFLGENQTYVPQSNIVQPYGSTLQFNSTLFVNREFNVVGVNTQPNFALDAESIYTNNTTQITDGLTIRNEININPNQSTLYFAFTETFSGSNLRPSTLFTTSIQESWILDTTIRDTNFSVFSPGLSFSSNVPTNYIPLSASYLPFYLLGGDVNGSIRLQQNSGSSNFYRAAFQFSPPPNIFTGMATDGTFYIAGGVIEAISELSRNVPLFRSSNNFTFWDFYPLDSNVFPGWSSPTSYRRGCYDIIYDLYSGGNYIAVGVGSTGPIWRSDNKGDNWSLVLTSQVELYSIVSTKLRSIGGIYYQLFFTGGATLLASGNTFVPGDGVVYLSQDGSNWNIIGSNFSGPVKEVATNGKVVVAAVSSATVSETLWYSPLTTGNIYNWQVCSGDLFTSYGNSVIWTGSEFVAGGDSGIRTSQDGITWSNPGTLSIPILNLSFLSNAATNIRFKDGEEKILLFQDSPNLQCQELISSPTISYYSNGVLNLNNAIIIDELANVMCIGLPTEASPLQGLFQSTFYAAFSYVSSFLSSSSVALGNYTIGIQSV